MMSIKLLLIESVTAGALDQPLAQGLLPEAELMLGAMVAEALAYHLASAGETGSQSGPQQVGSGLGSAAAALGSPRAPRPLAPGAVTPRVLRRASLPSRWPDIERPVAPAGWTAAWRDALAWADAVWLVAPETGGELETLSREVEAAGVRLLGCSAEAVAVAASKRATHAALSGRVRQPDDVGAAAGWVLKPDDGVAAEWVRWVAALGAGVVGELADTASPAMPPGWLAQPFVRGEALSLCVLSDGRTARVLSVNSQHIEWRADGAAQYCGGVTNAIHDRARFVPLAQAVQRAMPGLWGCWGIDCVLPNGLALASGPALGPGPSLGSSPPPGPRAAQVPLGDSAAQEPVLIEVNPRLTTAFAHLRQATGFDLLAALLDMAEGGEVPEAPAGHPVAFDLPATGGAVA
ncbi:MAG: ATP-grasp domain-containing protein [Rhodocyclaceae bacterium]|nr:ATP-grasp domain-containing protein [Rhodocyclaceae bacterium]